MNKLLIPTILVATVLVAGIFAMLPVENASAVHTTIQANNAQLVRATEVAANFVDIVDGNDLEIISTAPFCVVSMVVQITAVTGDAFGYSGVEIDNVALTRDEGTAVADTTVNDPNATETVTAEWIDNLDQVASNGNNHVCANGEIDWLMVEGGTLLAAEMDRVTAYVITTGGAAVTVDITNAAD